MEYWNSLLCQLITGQQDDLKAIMLEQMSDYTAGEIVFEELTIGEIVGWLVDNQAEIKSAGLIK